LEKSAVSFDPGAATFWGWMQWYKRLEERFARLILLAGASQG